MSAAALIRPGHGASLHAAVEAALRRLRDEGRRAVRIADLDCGSGRRLARIARRARALGFVAVEARGCGACDACLRDTGVEWRVDRTDPATALAEEMAEGAEVIILPERGSLGAEKVHA